jgi:hypothetical protein
MGIDVIEELKLQLGVSSPARQTLEIVPSDVQELTVITRALYVGESGDIRLELADDDAAVVLRSVPAGSLLPIQVRKVYATGTTAGSLVGLV